MQAVCSLSTLLVMFSTVSAQVTGGRTSFPFLIVSNSPHVTSMGSIVPASYDRDISLMLQNPALLNNKMHNQLALSYNRYVADISLMNLAYGYYAKNLDTDFGLSIQSVQYGKMIETDIYGNELGDMRASDLSINLSAARSYGRHWRYGVNLKMANSALAHSSAFAMLADVGIAYTDTSKLLSFGAVAKNMGLTLKKYNPGLPAEPLPFDLQIGVMKGLKNIPLRVFVVAHHLYEWDIRFNDPALIGTDLSGQPVEDVNAPKFADKLFRHFNFGTELTLAKRVTATLAYSHLRRSELGFKNSRGMAGFSFGLSVDLKKIYLQYGRSNYGNGIAYNEFGLILPLNKVIKTKPKFSERTGWNDVY